MTNSFFIGSTSLLLDGLVLMFSQVPGVRSLIVQRRLRFAMTGEHWLNMYGVSWRAVAANSAPRLVNASHRY